MNLHCPDCGAVLGTAHRSGCPKAIGLGEGCPGCGSTTNAHTPGCTVMRKEAIERVHQKVRDQLAWRGPGGRYQGHIVVTRAEAELLVSTAPLKGSAPSQAS